MRSSYAAIKAVRSDVINNLNGNKDLIRVEQNGKENLTVKS